MRKQHSSNVAAAITAVAFLSLAQLAHAESPNWPQAAGPNANWQVVGAAPTQWSVVRNENIAWRTPMPECGQSAVTVWGDKLFTTIHKPIDSFEERFLGSDIIGYCLDAKTGDVRWTVELSGTQSMELACGFSDATVFAPVTDGKYVWFFNRCGSMGCYDFEGNEVWFRKYPMRFKHSNRQCEPILVDGQILNVEVANKEKGVTIRKFKAGTSNTIAPKLPDGIDEKEVWTYLHGIDAATGNILWREQAGTSIHNTPLVGRLADGTPAIVHARGGGHGPLEKPYGVSLTSLAKDAAGATLWSTALPGYDPSFSNHWNSRYVFGFHKGEHVVLSTVSGEVLRRQQLYKSADLWERDGDDWKLRQGVAVPAGKGHPNTNHANMVVGDWHWFLAHNKPYIGRVHIETGKVEYLEVPAQLNASKNDRDHDKWRWGQGMKNVPVNARGFAIGRKGHDGTGFGHISAASPTLVGRHLFFPVVTGTVYVIDSTVERLTPNAIVSINDLGTSGETWTLSSFSYSESRLYMHTMRDVICIGTKP
ncbi:MAG: PQQ-like beta-propeller repeat protein [Planctomycetes bacterium]|nr:PQQ-like beta-propeller repeat protein [Planctomycetota bacterium]